MDEYFVLGLLHNIALLLASGVIFDYYWKNGESNLGWLKQVQIGFLLSIIGIILMLTPWKLGEGLVFDGRSILLSVSGLFFGLIPTGILMIITALYRLSMGGNGVQMGIMVILTAGTIGILWGKFRTQWQLPGRRYIELILMGFIVHVVMLGCTAFLPVPVRYTTIKTILWPTLLIYPLGSFLFGFFMLHRLQHWKTKAQIKANEERFRSFYENAPIAYHSLDIKGTIIEVNQSWLDMLGYTREEMTGRWIGEFLPQNQQSAWDEIFRSLLSKGEFDNTEITFIHKSGSEVITAAFSRVAYDRDGNFIQIHSVIYNVTENKKATQSIMKLHERLELAARAARFGVWDWDIISGRVEWDETMYTIYDKQKGEFDGEYSTWLSFIHPQDAGQINESFQLSLKGEKEFDTEFRFTAKNGENRIIRAIGQVTNDSEGNPIRMTGVNFDLTQRRLDKERLRDALQQLEVITTNIPNILWKADVKDDGTLTNTYISSVVDEFLKLPPNTINNDWGKFFGFILPEHIQTLNDQMKYVWQNIGQTNSIEYEVRKADGSKAWFLSAGRTHKTDNTLRLFGFTTDITERKRAEQKIAKNERLLRSYIEGAPDAIFVFDFEGKELQYNQSAVKLTGYPPEELKHLSLRHLMDTGVNRVSDDFFKKINATGSFNEEIPIYGKDGNKIPVIMSAVKIDDNRIIAFVKDITSIKQTQDELISAKERAEESDRVKSAFLATMSHELRTPLNAIIGFSALIEEEDNHSIIIENARIINKSGEHLLAIIESIFEIALLQSGKLKYNPGTFKAADLIRELIRIAESEKAARGKELLEIIAEDVSLDSDITIKTDQNRLLQLLSNFVVNAVKFTSQGSVKLGFTQDETSLTFFVKDTGIGIPSDKIDVIFDQFRQVDDSYTRIYGGVGLGLSICSEIAKILGGKINVETQEGKGSTFMFTLPNHVNNKSAAESEVKNNKKTTYRFDKKTVLLVDDLDDNLYLLDFMLSAAGATVLKATSGKEAIDIVKSSKAIDIVLMDIKMPEMDGYAATKEIHRIRPGLPVVAQTAFAMPGDKEKAIANGCIAYLPKPIKKAELLNLLNELLSETI